MSADYFANYPVVTLFCFYMANTDKQSFPNSETSQCSHTKYEHSWNTACPIKLVDWKNLLYNEP